MRLSENVISAQADRFFDTSKFTLSDLGVN